MSYPFVPLQHSAIHTNGLSEDLSNAVLRSQDLLTQILAVKDDGSMTMKELCALVQNLCAAGKCTEQQWQAVQDAMDIPHRKPDNMAWKKWIRRWCGLVVDPRKELRRVITDSWKRPADWPKMQWIYDFCHPMADAAEYRHTFELMLSMALNADHNWNPRIRYDRISLPLIALLERYSPPGMDDYKWVLFFQALATIAADADREQCVQICDFIMDSNTFARFFAGIDHRSAPSAPKLLLLSKLAQCSARHFQSAVFDFVLRIHRLFVPKGMVVFLAASDSRSIWTGVIMHAAGYGNLDAYKWLWENLDDESFDLKRTFENVLQQAMQSGNADLVEFMLTHVWSGAARGATLMRAWNFSRRYPTDYPDEVKAKLEEMMDEAILTFAAEA